MTRIKHGRQAAANRQRLDQHIEKVIVNNHSVLLAVRGSILGFNHIATQNVVLIARTQSLVHSVVFVAIQISLLPAVAAVMKKERIARARIRHKPVKCIEHILASGKLAVVARVVCQHTHAIGRVAKAPFFANEAPQRRDVVDAAAQRSQ